MGRVSSHFYYVIYESLNSFLNKTCLSSSLAPVVGNSLPFRGLFITDGSSLYFVEISLRFKVPVPLGRFFLETTIND